MASRSQLKRAPAGRHWHWHLVRRRPQLLRRASALALLAVVAPGLLAGLSDDDPAGITTYRSSVPTTASEPERQARFIFDSRPGPPEAEPPLLLAFRLAGEDGPGY